MMGFMFEHHVKASPEGSCKATFEIKEKRGRNRSLFH